MKRLAFAAVLAALGQLAPAASAQFGRVPSAPHLPPVVAVGGSRSGPGGGKSNWQASSGLGANYRSTDGRGGSTTAHGTYRTPNDFSAGYGRTNPGPHGHPGPSHAGTVSNGKNGLSAGFATDDGKGRTQGGQVNYRDPDHFRAQGQYGRKGSGYGGSVNNDGGKFDVGGNASTAGPVPGTRTNYTGDAQIRGRDTVIHGGAAVTDPTGAVRFGGGTGTLDRRHYAQTGNAGLGGVRGTQTQAVDFGGLNSKVRFGQGGQFGGAASAGVGGAADRHGATASGTLRVGGVNLGIKAGVTGHGVEAVPHLPTPKIDVPKVSIPAPKIELPRVKVPEIRVEAPKVELPW